jgi:phosphotriesterase-related protein
VQIARAGAIADNRGREMAMSQLFTTLGPRSADELGMILPHEHVFVDLRTPDTPGYADAEPDAVVALMAPEIARIQALGVTALVECTTGGVGRRADIDLAVSRATGLPIVVPTGNYREPWIPEWVRTASEAALEAWMVRELTQRFDEADYRAGWIKISAGDDGITELEARILRAAARAGAKTNAVIGSHTIKGRVVLEQLDIIEAEGYRAERFISIHTQEEKDFGLNRAVAERGAWIEYDHVGRAPDEEVAALIVRALEAGLGGQLLISHDLGWYDPAKPGGGTPRPYSHLSEAMLPRLRDLGIDAATLTQLTHRNPFAAFAR